MEGERDLLLGHELTKRSPAARPKIVIAIACEIDLSKWSYDGIRVLGDTRGHVRALIHSLWPLLGAVNTLFTVRTMYRGDQVWQRFR